MSKYPLCLIGAVVALLGGSPALAKSFSTLSNDKVVSTLSHDDVVVEGREKAIVERFVMEMIDPAPSGQLARWDGSVCSGIVGLAPDQAELVNSRIAAASSVAGLKMGDEGCRPTILTVVTTRPGELANAIAKRYEIGLRGDGSWRVSAFTHTNQPVRWIARTTAGGANGQPFDKGFVDRAPEVRFTGSRLTKSTQTNLSGMLVIVDARQVAGLPARTLGDYLAMVALTRPKLGSSPSKASILSYFDDSTVDELTEMDRRYLASLYRAPANGTLESQRSSIKSGMRTDN